jgi:uncharacterized protein
MRIIITGGTGLIVGALSENLSRDGHDVIVLTRNLQKQRDDLPKGVRLVEWDGLSSEGWGHEINKADALVNLEAHNLPSGRWTESTKQKIRQNRIQAGQAVVEAVVKAERKPRVVIQASCVRYYGPRNDQRQVTEKAPPGKDFLADVCIDWEKSTAPVEQLGVRRPIIRSGVVLSTEEGALPKLALPHRLFLGGPVGSGRQWIPWIHIADEVIAIRFLIENSKANGPYNLTSPNPLTYRSFGRVLSKVLKRPYFIPVPAFMIKLLYGEMSTVILDGQRAVPKRLQELGFRFLFPEAEPALRDLYKK